LSLVALHALGYPPGHPAQAAGLARLDEADGPPGPYGALLPPVAHTVLAIEALSSAGLPADHATLRAAGGWLFRQRVDAAASGPAPRSGPRPSGWSFCPDGYPRSADTACVLIALGALDLPAVAGSAADAVRWLAATQRRDGSWARSAAVTGYCVRALAGRHSQQAPVLQAMRRGVIWLLRAQLQAGAWPGSHGGGDLLATTVALVALRAAGVLPGKPSVTSAVGWLLAQQNADGGWYLGDLDDPRQPAASDSAGTAHALSALLAAGRESEACVDAAAGWLISAQLPDGSWPAPELTDARAHALRRPGSFGPPVSGVLLPLRALGSYAGTVAPRPG
jgi:squalene cyclase